MTAITQRIVPTKPGLKLSDKERSKRIMKWIRFRDRQLRRRFPFLKNQDRLGMGITVGSAVGMLLFAGLYITGFIPAWTCILANGILASLLHEIEHDLIHNLYYKDNLKSKTLCFGSYGSLGEIPLVPGIEE